MATSENLASFAKDIPSKEPSKLRLRRTLKGHSAKVHSFDWNSNSRYIVSASQDGKLLVWDAITGNKLEVIFLRSSWVMSCAFSPSGTFVACGGLENICYLYNLKGKEPPTKPLKELAGHDAFVGCCKFLDEKRLITASGDHSCALWDLETGVRSREFKEHQKEVMGLSLNPKDNNYFLSCGVDTFVKLWDIRSPKSAFSVKIHEADVNCVTYFPTGNSFATASEDKTVKIFDLRANAELMKYQGSNVNCNITSVCFSLGGSYLFAGQEDCNVSVYDTIRGNFLYKIDGHLSRISSVGVSPDGMALCTSSWDNELKIWA